eukprot:4950481-Lingulodinium_polyedra.AAC.1
MAGGPWAPRARPSGGGAPRAMPPAWRLRALWLLGRRPGHCGRGECPCRGRRAVERLGYPETS